MVQPRESLIHGYNASGGQEEAQMIPSMLALLSVWEHSKVHDEVGEVACYGLSCQRLLTSPKERAEEQFHHLRQEDH